MKFKGAESRLGTFFVGECHTNNSYTYLVERRLLMKESDKLLYKTLKALLNERLSQAEVDQLMEEGFLIKSPTRKTAVMIALYKKAASGDLSAIKELRSIVSEKNENNHSNSKAVMIVDDITD